MKLEIENRKLTTYAGLHELASLVSKLSTEMSNDVWNFDCPLTFRVKVLADNGYSTNDIYYHEWYLNVGRWVFRNGTILLQADSSDEYDGEPLNECELVRDVDFTDSIYKIDFADAIMCLEKLVEAYNKKTALKEQELTTFLKLVAEYKEVL